MNVYRVNPAKETKAAVVVIYDVFGFNGGRIKGVCDKLGEEFHVYMPDLYGEGASLNDVGGLPALAEDKGKDWLRQFTYEKLEPKIKDLFTYISSLGYTSVGAIGFCWGVWMGFKLSAHGLLKCNVGCHPSLVVGEMLFNESSAEQAAAVKCPQLLCPAGNDPDNVKEGGEVPQVIRDKGLECKVVVFPEMKHGWVPRGDASDATVARDVQKALDEAIAFFKKYLVD